MPQQSNPQQRTNQTTGQNGQGQQSQQRNGQRARQKKLTEYATQLIEKQKIRNSYGLREKQFRKYFDAAGKFSGQTGNVLLTTLERRLDNTVFRSGMAKSRAQARQLISHRHFAVNGKRVNVASLLVSKGDVITPNKITTVSYNPETIETDWLKTDKKSGKITVERLPEKNDLPIEFDTQKVIEFYSR